MTEEQGVIQEIHPPLEIEESPSMSAEIAEIATALSKAQGEIEFAAKTTENTFFKSRYADLAEVWKAARKPLSENELAVVQLTQGGPVLITIVTILTHSSGQWMRSEFTVKPVPKKDKQTGEIKEIGPQELGSAITYGRRYAMAAIVGITQDDDDANAASGNNKAAANKPQAPAAAAPAKTQTNPNIISEPQLKRLWAIANKTATAAGIDATALVKDSIARAMGDNAPEHTKDIPKANYEAIVTMVENSGQNAA